MRKQEMTKAEYDSLPVYMKNRIEPVFIDGNEEVVIMHNIDEAVVEEKRDEKRLHSATDLKDMNKKQQEIALEELGMSKNDIQKLKTEKSRIDKVLELQKSQI